MEVEQIRALTGLELFGLIGGYLGMFLGTAFIQIPELILRIKSIYNDFHSR